MEGIKVETSQNVAIDYKIASIVDRMVALGIDIVIQLSVYLVGLFTASTFLSGSKAMIVAAAILSVPVLFYHFICETTMNGQSFGKKALNIKVIKKDGSQPTIGSYFLRWILRLIEVDMLSGSLALITIIANGEGQRLGDMAAGTTVIKLESKNRLKDTIYSDIDINYTPVYREVSRLADGDIQIVKDVLDHVNKGYEWKTYTKMIWKTRDLIAHKMEINPQQNALEFLKTVLKDYNAVNR